MEAHETRDVEQLSDEKRTLLIGDNTWVYRQPGGCFEIGHRSDAVSVTGEDLGQDLIHICETADWDALIAGMQAVRDRVPQRF